MNVFGWSYNPNTFDCDFFRLHVAVGHGRGRDLHGHRFGLRFAIYLFRLSENVDQRLRRSLALQTGHQHWVSGHLPVAGFDFFDWLGHRDATWLSFNSWFFRFVGKSGKTNIRQLGSLVLWINADRGSCVILLNIFQNKIAKFYINYFLVHKGATKIIVIKLNCFVTCLFGKGASNVHILQAANSKPGRFWT